MLAPTRRVLLTGLSSRSDTTGNNSTVRTNIPWHDHDHDHNHRHPRRSCHYRLRPGLSSLHFTHSLTGGRLAAMEGLANPAGEPYA